MSSSRILQIKRKPFHYIHAEDLMVYEAIRVLDCVSDLELVRSQIRGGHLLWGMLQTEQITGYSPTLRHLHTDEKYLI